MSKNQRDASISESFSFSRFYRKAITEKSFLPILLAVVMVILILIAILAPSADAIISLAESHYGRVIFLAIAIVVILVVISIFVTRYLDDVSDKTPLLNEIDSLRQELSSTHASLAIAQAHCEDLKTLQSLTVHRLAQDLLQFFENYLEEFASEVEQVKRFKQSSSLTTGNLKTTHVQLYQNGLAVSLPVGKKHGLMRNMTFVLSLQPATPGRLPTRLGIATLSEVEPDRSAAIVQPEPLQEAYWRNVQGKCEYDDGGFDLELEAVPAIHPLFQDCELDTLETVQELLKEMMKFIKNWSQNMWEQSAGTEQPSEEATK